jgi:hypothetical protein
VDNMV